MRAHFRGLLLLAMMLAMTGVAAGTGVASLSAQASGTIEVHARMCDEVPVDGNWYGACHDSLSPNTLFEATNISTGEVVSGTTGPDGNVVLNVPSGTWQLAGPPGEFVEATLIFCSTGAGTPEVAHPVEVGDGTAIVCDYYFVPEDLSGGGTIEVHARMCDSIPANDDWFGSCHDDIAPDIYFDAIETMTGDNYVGTTDASGNLVFHLPPGTWQLSGPPGDFLKATVVFCSTGPNTPQVAHPVTLAAGDAVICDYYFVPDDLSGRTPTPVPTAMPTAVPNPTAAPTAAPTRVPVEPRPPLLELPVILVAGTCEDVTNATEVTQLADAEIRQGTAQGSVDALQAAVGYTSVPISLDTLLASDHVIAVLAPDDADTVVACGAIGGVPDGQGAFTIGLAPVDDSGAAGTAYLAPRSSGAAAGTGISVFIVPDGLMPEPVLQPVG